MEKMQKQLEETEVEASVGGGELLPPKLMEKKGASIHYHR